MPEVIQRGGVKPLQVLYSFHPTQLPFQERGDGTDERFRNRSGIAVGCLLADVSFLVGGKAFIARNCVLWSGLEADPNALLNCLASFYKEEYTLGGGLGALWIGKGLCWS